MRLTNPLSAAATSVPLLATAHLHARQPGPVASWGAQVVVPQSALTNLTRVAAGASHSLALTSGGAIAAWGNNASHHCDVPAPHSGCLAIAATVIATAPAALAQPSPTITDLGVLPGAPQSVARAISTDGAVVVGWSGAPQSRRAFRWTAAGGMQGLGVLPGDAQSEALAVNADGSVMVGWSGYNEFNGRAVRWSAAQGIEDLGMLPGDVSARAAGVSGDGALVVGTSVDGGGGLGYRAFRWTRQSGMQELTPPGWFGQAISPDGAVVVGWSFWGVGFRWTIAGGMEYLHGIDPRASSADGAVLAGIQWSCGKKYCWPYAARWTAESGAEVLYMGTATAISGDGSAVSGALTTALYAAPHAVLWTRELGALDLNEYLPGLGLNLVGWRLEHASGLSHDARVIAGTGRLNGQTRAWLVQMGGGCYPDCNTDGALTVGDFACFQARFASGDPYADCNADGLLSVSDFGCFQTEFVTGCP